MSQYHFNDNTNSFNKVWNNYTIVDDRSQILTWLSPLEPKLRHQDVQNRRVENVGEWLLRTEEFSSWCASSGGSESDNAVLFCYGDPGVGKTYISSLVIDSLCDQAGPNATTACLYFDFAAQKEQSSTSMLGALLKQLVSGLEEIPEEISRTYQSQKKAIGGRGPRHSEIVKMLQTTSSKERTFICIDALDECVEGHRAKLLDSINQILEDSPGTRIFVTGRPHIRPEIGRRLSRRLTSVPISPRGNDIIRYLHSRLDEDAIPDAMDSALKADILKKIPEEVSEIFLLVSLNIDAILRETTIHRRRQKLSTMTNDLGLEGAYGATLDRIKGQGSEKSRLGMAALMWISHSERPLRADELCHALAVEAGSPELNSDNVPSIGTLLVCCQGLVAIDKEASTVRLIHFTLQEHLRAHPELFGTAHSTMAEICLSCLNSQQVRALSTSSFPDLQDTPFLEYSATYWGVYAKRDLSDSAKSLALELFKDYNDHISIKILLESRAPHSMAARCDKRSPFSGLHCASIFGIVEIVASLVAAEGCDINQEDCTGNTPLAWAVDNGHEEVVEILLGLDDVNPNKPGERGRTPLCRAADNGNEGVVKMLLGRDEVNPNKLDNIGQTPLHRAALWGYQGVVKMLLERDEVSPDESDNLGQTPLCCAALCGHEGVVKMLLGQDEVNPDKPDCFGQTPIYHAAHLKREGVLKVLLGRNGVNPDKPDNRGQTPLYCAAECGHEEVVKMLLGRYEVNPDKPDNDGQTPLYCAARYGHEGVVEMLLGRDEVNPDKPDHFGQTPIYYAAQYGHEGVVKILLARDEVDPNRPDNDDQTVANTTLPCCPI